MFTRKAILRGVRLSMMLVILLQLMVIPSGNILAQDANEQATYKIYLPLILQQSGAAPGLYGKVTLNGSPVSGVALELRFYNGSAWSTVSNMTTDSGGGYSFKNVPALSSEQADYVRYTNGSDPSRLSAWFTGVNQTYNGTSAVVFDTFDIADIMLLTPQAAATVSLPAVFTWYRRPASPTDSYEFDLVDPTDDSPHFFTLPLGYKGSYTLDSLPPNFSKGVEYGWYVIAYSPDGGSGMSFYYNPVTFK